MKRLGLQSSIYNGLQLKDEIYTAVHHNISTFDIFFDTWSPSEISEETRLAPSDHLGVYADLDFS